MKNSFQRVMNIFKYVCALMVLSLHLGGCSYNEKVIPNLSSKSYEVTKRPYVLAIDSRKLHDAKVTIPFLYYRLTTVYGNALVESIKHKIKNAYNNVYVTDPFKELGDYDLILNVSNGMNGSCLVDGPPCELNSISNIVLKDTKNNILLNDKYVDNVSVSTPIRSMAIAVFTGATLMSFTPFAIDLEGAELTRQMTDSNDRVAAGIADKLLSLDYSAVSPHGERISANSESLQPITISIISPEVDRGVKIIEKSSRLLVSGYVQGGSGVAEVHINSQLADLGERGYFSTGILLNPGENQITIQASDTQRRVISKTFSVHRELVKTTTVPQHNQITSAGRVDSISTGKYYALLIAVQDYSNKEINKLDYPIADATNVKNILTGLYTFEDKNVILLRNPDRKTISKAFNELRQQLSENDNLFIFYAGHGIWMNDMKEGYWLPRDASGANDPTDWIPNSTIRNQIRALKAKHVLLVADACFSGGIFKVRDAFINPTASVEKIYALPSRKAITSGALRTVPDKSVFVEYLLKRLTENQETYLDSQKLFISFKEAVINNSPGNQTPLYGAISEAGDEGGDFIFVRRK